MALVTGRYTLGPDDGTLSVRTKKGGAIAKAGHDLLIRVTDWSATLDVGEDNTPAAIELTADSRSMQVLEGTGGLTSLGEDEKTGIAQTINEEVLKGTPVAFRSTTVTAADGAGHLEVSGELEIAGTTRPASFSLSTEHDRITGTATLTQSNWGIKPYSALFGTLKVLDDVTVEVDAQLPERADNH
jgi:polyisoprenoid-binding protein YceI